MRARPKEECGETSLDDSTGGSESWVGVGFWKKRGGVCPNNHHRLAVGYLGPRRGGAWRCVQRRQATVGDEISRRGSFEVGESAGGRDDQNIKSARSILIIGGGPVGVELAAEIGVDFPDKKITLIHSGSRLMEFTGPKASERTLDWLRTKNVDVKLEQLVDLNSLSDGTYTTSHGETIDADCHFLCTGKPLASSWLKETFLKENLDRFGILMVDQCMTVEDRDNIFAVGDITEVREIRQGFLAQKHATAVKKLKLLMDGGKESETAVYEPRSVKAIVLLGRKQAVAQFLLPTIIGRIPGMIKSKDLFVGKTRKLMGLKPYIVYS
ncbi:uncharacterized protein LOC115679269 [Syzygium oleosum]|uniref:uncharacterized protein LOC115679269 n=1 Tax=Syzygium oleosum TaxID=219896 RepID=UPI0024BA5040|nr:uncharacterized protein LOC115679269 [Syzygium oleosum]